MAKKDLFDKLKGKGSKSSGKKATGEYANGSYRYHLSEQADHRVVSTEDKIEEQITSRPALAQQKNTFASILGEVRGVLRIPDVAQQTAEENNLKQKNQDERKSQPNLTATTDNQSRRDATYKVRDVDGSRNDAHTSVALCAEGHMRLECHWSFNDPINSQATWHLNLADYRRDKSVAGAKEHRKCICRPKSKLVELLSTRMFHDMREWDETQRRQRYEHDIAKTDSSSVEKIQRELSKLIVPLLNQASGIDFHDRKDRKEKKEDNGNTENQKKETLAKERKQKELTRLKRLLNTQRDDREIDKQRIKRSADERAAAQRMVNGAHLATEPRKKAPNNPSQAKGPASILKKQIQVQERPLKASPVKRKTKNKDMSEITMEGQKALRSIQAAEREESERLDQDEKDEETRQQQLSADQGPVRNVDENQLWEDDLEAAFLEHFEQDVSDSEARKPRKTTNEGVARQEVAKQHTHPFTKELVEESESLKAPQLSRSIKPTQKGPAKIRKPAIPFAQYLAAKASAKASVPDTEGTIKDGQFEKPSGASKGPGKKGVKAAGGKLEISKSAGLLTNTNKDLKSDTETAIRLPADKLGDDHMSVNTVGHETTTAPVEQSKAGAEALINITTASSESPKLYKSTKCTKVTGFTSVVDDTSNEVEVEHAAHIDSAPPSESKHIRRSLDSLSALDSESNVSSQPSSPLPSSPESTSKRKRSATVGVVDADSDTTAKKRKTISPAPLAVDDAAAADPQMDTYIVIPSPVVIGSVEAKSDTPPNAASVASSTSSSSSKKRKMVWSEEDGEISISPGGTKRVRRSQDRHEKSIETIAAGDDASRGAGSGDGSMESENETPKKTQGTADTYSPEVSHAGGWTEQELDSFFEE